MKYVFTYTVVATFTFALCLYAPGPAMTDVVAAFGSHLCGCLAASILWFFTLATRLQKEARQFLPPADTPPRAEGEAQ